LPPVCPGSGCRTLARLLEESPWRLRHGDRHPGAQFAPDEPGWGRQPWSGAGVLLSGRNTGRAPPVRPAQCQRSGRGALSDPFTAEQHANFIHNYCGLRVGNPQSAQGFVTFPHSLRRVLSPPFPQSAQGFVTPAGAFERRSPGPGRRRHAGAWKAAVWDPAPHASGCARTPRATQPRRAGIVRSARAMLSARHRRTVRPVPWARVARPVCP